MNIGNDEITILSMRDLEDTIRKASKDISLGKCEHRLRSRLADLGESSLISFERYFNEDKFRISRKAVRGGYKNRFNSDSLTFQLKINMIFNKSLILPKNYIIDFILNENGKLIERKDYRKIRRLYYPVNLKDKYYLKTELFKDAFVI